MSIKVICLIWEEHTGFLTGIEKSILMRMADFGSDSGHSIYPGKTRLAEDTGFSLATVKRTLSSLQSKKILTIKNRKSKVQNITNLYSINVKLLKKLSEKSGVDKSKKGGVTQTLPRVTQNPGGGVTVSPDPLYSNPYINNNRTAAVDDLKNEMKKIEVSEFDMNQYLEKYTEEQIKTALKITNQKPREKPPAYFRRALEGQWKVSDKKRVSSTPYPSVEETQTMLDNMYLKK